MKNPCRDWPLFILALDEENSASSSHEPRASGRSCTWGSRRDIHPGDRVRRSERRCLMRIADVRTCGPPAVGRAVASPLVNGCGAPTHLHFTGHHHHLGPTHHPGTWETSTPQSAGTPSIPPPGSLAAPVRQWDPTDTPDRPCQCRSMATPLHQTAAAPWMDGAPLLLACSTKGGLGTLGDPLCPAGLGGRCSKIRQVGTARRALLGLRNHRRVR